MPSFDLRLAAEQFFNGFDAAFATFYGAVVAAWPGPTMAEQPDRLGRR